MGYLSRHKQELPKAREFYDSVGSVDCPYFNTKVTFNAKGFHHLQYSAGSERTKQAQLYKFALLESAVEILKHSGTVQQYRQQLGTVGHKKGKSGLRDTNMMTYWAFEAIVGKNEPEFRRVKVIVRQIGNGEPHFWSVMSDTNLRRKSNYKLATDDVLDD